jgi:crotonobetainyl-CoA:carnitine CoA-transferase CaiB-like acyl-CoA transferase
MPGPLSGVRVLEVASHVLVPMAGAVLTEWGAEVVKVEHPETGDPYRALTTAGLHNVYQGHDPFFQSANRGKRSVGIDLKQPAGRDVLARLIATSDVFITNLREDARRRLGIDVADVRADNETIIYVRGSAFGPLGPDAGQGGYDASAYWARSGMQHLLTSADDEWPRPPRPAFGDVVGGLAIAGAIGVALFRRATSGEASVIDASLLATGIWQVQPDVMNAALGASTGATATPPGRYDVWNPLTLPYRTSDARYVALIMVASDRNWPQLCTAIGAPDLAASPQFADPDARRANARVLVERLEQIFAARTLAQWRVALADFHGEWAPVQTPREVHDDVQVIANSYIAKVEMADGVVLPMVTAPVQFDGRSGQPTRAPEHGEHTEEVLLELGMSWPELSALKGQGAIL